MHNGSKLQFATLLAQKPCTLLITIRTPKWMVIMMEDIVKGSYSECQLNFLIEVEYI
jgi:hypothetical protein